MRRKNNPSPSRRVRSSRRSAPLVSRVQGTSVSPDRPFSVQLRAKPIVLQIAAGTSIFSTSVPLTFNSSTVFAPSSLSMINAMQEWRVTSVTAIITPLSSTSGSSGFGFTMDTTGLVSSWQSMARIRVIPNTNQGTHNSYHMTWKAKSFDDLSFVPTSSLVPEPVTFFWYTNTADYGTPTIPSDTAMFRVDFNVSAVLRGLGNN